MDVLLLNRLREWNSRAERTGRAQFSPFLNLEEQSALQSLRRETGEVTLFGGCEGCERVMARFGGDTPFPIVCVLVRAPGKFAPELSHRDYLGALMNLGIKRECVGDIVVRGKDAYVFLTESVEPFVEENLTRVANTAVRVSRTDDVPAGELYRTREETAVAASLRIDCLIAAAFDLSRSQCVALLDAQKVFVNGALCENHAATVKENEIVSVRGMGRFRYLGEEGQTRKGRTRVRIARYV